MALSTTQIYVSNLPAGTTDDRLNAAFEQFGAIEDCFVPQRKRFGFVTFAAEADATRALIVMNGKSLDAEAAADANEEVIAVVAATPKSAEKEGEKKQPKKKKQGQGQGRLSGKVAVVTGASSGIGQAIAITLAREGASVALGARRIQKLEETKAAIEANGGHACCLATDVTKRAQVKALVAMAESEFGPLDIMVNNAGVMFFTLMKNCNEDQWEQTIDVNCKGCVNGIGAALPGFLERGAGHIVCTSSDASRRMFPTLAVYCGSKQFIDAVCEGTRRELVGTGVKVTVIQPGDVAGTELIMQNSDNEAADKMGVAINKPVGEGFNKFQLLQAQDIADAVIYAVTAPAHVAVNEILIEPRDQE